MAKQHITDLAIAGVVIICSLIILAALTVALSGATFGNPQRIVRVAFPEITGVRETSAVRYAGANAGRVFRVHTLTPEERLASGHPENTIILELALSSSIPALTSGTTAAISADTLLSEKFVQLIPGPADAVAISNDTLLTGEAPTPFDQLSHSADRALAAISLILTGNKLDTGTIFSDVRTLLEQTQTLLKQAEPILTNAGKLIDNAGTVVGDAGSLVGDGRTVITDPRISETLTRLRDAAASLDRLSQSGEGMLKKNEANINTALVDMKVSLQNLKILTTYGALFTQGVAERPQSLIWGPRRVPELPTKSEILRSRQLFEKEN